MCVCEREIERHKERERSAVCSRSGVILCVSGTVCIPGLPALFIPDSFVLVLSLTLCATPHMLLAHQIIPAHAQAKAMKLLMYLFIGMANGLYVVLGNSTALIHF